VLNLLKLQPQTKNQIRKNLFMNKLKSILEKYKYDFENKSLEDISKFNDELSNLSLELNEAQNKIHILEEMVDNGVLSNSTYLQDALSPITNLLSHPLMRWAKEFQKEEILNELNDSFVQDQKTQDLVNKILANKELAKHLLLKTKTFQKGK
jgi:hypothetical protein